MLKKLLKGDILKMGFVDISHSRNYLSEICQKWDWLKYLPKVITQARSIKNGIGWYILLEKLLEQDMSKMGFIDISRSTKLLKQDMSKIGIGWYILLEKFLERDMSKMGLVDMSCSKNYSSEICRKMG